MMPSVTSMMAPSSGPTALHTLACTHGAPCVAFVMLEAAVIVHTAGLRAFEASQSWPGDALATSAERRAGHAQKLALPNSNQDCTYKYAGLFRDHPSWQVCHCMQQ